MLEQKKLLQSLLATPEGIYSGCIIIFSTSAPSAVHPTEQPPKYKPFLLLINQTCHLDCIKDNFCILNFLKVVCSRRHSTGPRFLTRIFSTRVKGVSKASTKMAAALREMRRLPMKNITTLNMVIWAVDGPPLFGLYPNGLFTIGLFMIGLSPFGLPMMFGLLPFGLF